jgi:hypothetical protein
MTGHAIPSLKQLPNLRYAQSRFLIPIFASRLTFIYKGQCLVPSAYPTRLPVTYSVPFPLA